MSAKLHDHHHGELSTDIPTITVEETDRPTFHWSILDRHGNPIPRADPEPKQGFIGFTQLKER